MTRLVRPSQRKNAYVRPVLGSERNFKNLYGQIVRGQLMAGVASLSVNAFGVQPLKVLIADDHPLMRVGVRRALDRSEDIEVVGEACSASELLALIPRRRPGLVLMELRMPGSIGTECIEHIRKPGPR